MKETPEKVGDAVVTHLEEAVGSDEEGSEEENYPLILEQNFDAIDFVKRFASPKVVKICNTLLSTYDTNSETTNHCIVKLLYRIAWECKMPAMLFQASLFIKFRNILANYEPKYKELAKLAVYITRKFTEVAESNKIVFVELLFPKHVKDACEIVDGYGTYQDQKNKRIAWEEHEEDELRRLDEEYRSTNVKEDKVSWILENLINKERSRRGVVKKMKELGLEVPENKPKGFWDEEQEEELKRLYEECDKDLPNKLVVSWIHERMASSGHSALSIKKKMYELNLLQKPVKKLKLWTEEQDEDLIELFNLHKNDDDVMRPIMAVLGTLRSRQNVVRALLRLGLIADKSEIRKKSRSQKSRPGHSESEEDSDSESEDDTENVRREEEERPPPLGAAAAALLREMLTSKYLLGGLKWLISALNDNLEDLDAEVFDADVPLLPLSEEPVLSMENDTFKNFLHALGFKRPVQHQEVYWRVSSSWKESDFLARIQLFNFIIEHHERNLEEIANDLNEKLAAASGEDVNVLQNDVPSRIGSFQAESSSKKKAKCSSKDVSKGTKPKKSNRPQDFLKEDGGRDIDSEGKHSSDDETSGRRRRKLSSGSEEENGSGDDRSSSRNPVATGDNGEVPGISSQMSDDEASGDKPPANKRTSRPRINSESEGEEVRSILSPRRMSKALEESDDDEISPKRRVSGSSRDSERSRQIHKKLNILDSDEEDDLSPIGGVSSGTNEPPKDTYSTKETTGVSDDEMGARSSFASKSSICDNGSSSRTKRKFVDSDEESHLSPTRTYHKQPFESEGFEGKIILSSPATKKRVRCVSDVETEIVQSNEPVIDGDYENSSTNGISAKLKKKKFRMIESDDEVDDPVSMGGDSESLGTTGRRVERKKSRLNDSDDDLSSHSSVASKASDLRDPQSSTKGENDESPARERSKAIIDSDDDLGSQVSIIGSKGNAEEDPNSRGNGTTRTPDGKKSKSLADSDDDLGNHTSASCKASCLEDPRETPPEEME